MANTTSSSTAPATIAEDWNSRGLPRAAVGAVHGAALNAAFLSFNVCLAAAFVLFSKPSERRSTIFHLHLFSFICAGTYFITQIAVQPLTILLYATQAPNGVFEEAISLVVCRWGVVEQFFVLFSPLVADSSLLFRLSAMYPSSTATRTKRCLMLGPFVAVLTVRLALSILGACYVSEDTTYIKSGGSYFDALGTINPVFIVTIVDFSLQILSCTYVSALIILRARWYRKQMQAKLQRKGLTNNEKRLWHKLNHFVESVLMGFVPPLLCQLLYLATFHSSILTVEAISAYAYTSNVFLSAFFAVLATTWSTVRDAVPRRFSSSQDTRSLSREPEQDGRRRAVAERSIINNFLERAGGDSDDEEDIEFVGTTQSSPDEEKLTPALPTRGTSEWRTHLSRQLGSKQQRPST